MKISKLLLATLIMATSTTAFAMDSSLLTVTDSNSCITTYTPADNVSKEDFFNAKAYDISPMFSYGRTMSDDKSKPFNDGVYYSNFETNVDIDSTDLGGGPFRTLVFDGTVEEGWSGNKPSAYADNIKTTLEFTVSGISLTANSGWVVSAAGTKATYKETYSKDHKFAMSHDYSMSQPRTTNAFGSFSQVNTSTFTFGSTTKTIDSSDKITLW